MLLLVKMCLEKETRKHLMGNPTKHVEFELYWKIANLHISEPEIISFVIGVSRTPGKLLRLKGMSNRLTFTEVSNPQMSNFEMV